MRLSTIIGFIIGMLIILVTIYIRGGVEMLAYFVNLPSVIVVFGGTMAAILINFSFRQILDGLKAFRYTLVSKIVSPEAVIEIIVEMAVKARREGFMSIRELSTKGSYQLLDIGVDLVADGTDPEVTRGILETVSDYLQMKISTDERLWRDISVYAPRKGSHPPLSVYACLRQWEKIRCQPNPMILPRMSLLRQSEQFPAISACLSHLPALAV